MTPSALIRKGLPIALAATLSGCGMVESDPHRFENLAQRVADIRLSAEPSRDAPAYSGANSERAESVGLRPALQVQVLDPHALWDARDGGLRGLMETAAPAVAEAAAPMVVRAVADEAARAIGRTPALAQNQAAAASPDALLQLGAFSSADRAQEAWTRLSSAAPLSALSPIYETVHVGGRDLVRLKVRAPAGAASEICRAAQTNDPWCTARVGS